MSGLKDRIAARIAPAPPLVPERIRALYADDLIHIPQVRIVVRKASPGQHLPAVGSFYD